MTNDFLFFFYYETTIGQLWKGIEKKRFRFVNLVFAEFILPSVQSI
jgi:hypothetical protein